MSGGADETTRGRTATMHASKVTAMRLASRRTQPPVRLDVAARTNDPATPYLGARFAWSPVRVSRQKRRRAGARRVPPSPFAANQGSFNNRYERMKILLMEVLSCLRSIIE